MPNKNFDKHFWNHRNKLTGYNNGSLFKQYIWSYEHTVKLKFNKVLFI